MTTETTWLIHDEKKLRNAILWKIALKNIFFLIAFTAAFGFAAFKIEEWYWKLILSALVVFTIWQLGKEILNVIKDLGTNEKIIKTGKVVDYGITWQGSSGEKTRTETLRLDIHGEELKLDGTQLNRLDNYKDIRPYFNETCILRAEMTPHAGILIKLEHITGEPKEYKSFSISLG